MVKHRLCRLFKNKVTFSRSCCVCFLTSLKGRRVEPHTYRIYTFVSFWSSRLAVCTWFQMRTYDELVQHGARRLEIHFMIN